jgi:hypothetical protein
VVDSRVASVWGRLAVSEKNVVLAGWGHVATFQVVCIGVDFFTAVYLLGLED